MTSSRTAARNRPEICGCSESGVIGRRFTPARRRHHPADERQPAGVGGGFIFCGGTKAGHPNLDRECLSTEDSSSGLIDSREPAR
jgi:hypothetical protein